MFPCLYVCCYTISTWKTTLTTCSCIYDRFFFFFFFFCGKHWNEIRYIFYYNQKKKISYTYFFLLKIRLFYNFFFLLLFFLCCLYAVYICILCVYRKSYNISFHVTHKLNARVGVWIRWLMYYYPSPKGKYLYLYIHNYRIDRYIFFHRRYYLCMYTRTSVHCYFYIESLWVYI